MIPYNECTPRQTRLRILNEVNRKLNKMCTIHKSFRSKLGRCYYIVDMSNAKAIVVRILSAEAALTHNGRQILRNSELYAKYSYYGQVSFAKDKCRFNRQINIRESVTYATGEVLFELTLTNLKLSFGKKAVEYGFGKWLEELEGPQTSLPLTSDKL